MTFCRELVAMTHPFGNQVTSSVFFFAVMNEGQCVRSGLARTEYSVEDKRLIEIKNNLNQKRKG